MLAAVSWFAHPEDLDLMAISCILQQSHFSALVHITGAETNGPEKAKQTYANIWDDSTSYYHIHPPPVLLSQGRKVFNSSSYLYLSLILHRLPGNAVIEHFTFQFQPLFLLIGKCFVSTNHPGIFPIKTSSQSR